MTEGSDHITKLDKGALKRVLSTGDLFAVGYGDLGSSIYYALGITAAFALGATPLALGLAGLVFICTALTYAELTSMFSDAGGSASFAQKAFNDLISFIAGWGLLLDYIVTIAISAFAVAPYLACFYADFQSKGIQISFTLALIFILLGINLLGVRQSTRMSLLLMSVTILVQLVVIFIGTQSLFNWDYLVSHVKINSGALWSPTWQEFWKGTAMAMVAYTGIESMAQLGSEAKRPTTVVPRAILVTMGVLVFMYLGISVVALSVISPLELSTKYVHDPLAGIAHALPWGSAFLTPFMGLLAAAILFVAANAGLVGASRLSFRMGAHYQLPRFFYYLHPKLRTPVISLGFFALLAGIIVLWSRGEMSFLADLYNFGAMLAFFFAHLSLIALRFKEPERKRGFQIACNVRLGKYRVPLTALVGCLATLGVWILVVITKPAGRYLGLSWMGIGLLMYYLYRRKEHLSATRPLAIEKIKVPEFQAVSIRTLIIVVDDELHMQTMQLVCELAKAHGARLIALHVIEVPPSLPLREPSLEDTPKKRPLFLKKLEAVAREFTKDLILQSIQARSQEEALLEVCQEEACDLLVLEASSHSSRDKIREKIARKASCPVWISYISE